MRGTGDKTQIILSPLWVLAKKTLQSQSIILIVDLPMQLSQLQVPAVLVNSPMANLSLREAVPKAFP
ncbi:hypothetical protein CAY53_07430 [Desulfobulbus oralis]|uniref:Uncharacterized protein n=1 Tax=Desulfobulbus oralis TaxID=1986146 RepID=A0A2L1GNQ9_9BACT|nr:hypothetical protein CAY53_07430 [Desulfobulbus oralis]